MNHSVRDYRSLLSFILFSSVISSPAFEITSFQVSETETTIEWEGGNPPYQLETSSDLDNWTEFGTEQTATSVTIPTRLGESLFFRVVYQIEEPPTLPFELTSGTFEVPQFSRTSDATYHTARAASGTLPATLPDTVGRQLVIELFDVDNPTVRCTFDHPLGGCTTIDWDDFQESANVPPSGYFDNSFTTTMAGTERKLFLRRDLSLSLVNNSHPIE